MPRRLTESNLAVHNYLMGQSRHSRSIPSNIAEQGSTTSSRSGPGFTANDRIRQAAAMRDPAWTRHTGGNYAHHDNSWDEPNAVNPNSTSQVCHDAIPEPNAVGGDQRCVMLTPGGFEQYLGGSRRTQATGTQNGFDEGVPRLAEENLGRHDEEMDPRLLRNQYDYSNIGWHRAEHREGWGSMWEPRAGRRR